MLLFDDDDNFLLFLMLLLVLWLVTGRAIWGLMKGFSGNQAFKEFLKSSSPFIG